MPPELNVSDREAIELSVTFPDYEDALLENSIDEESSTQAGNFVFQLQVQDNEEDIRMFLYVTRGLFNVS
jgi:hypothetical protein